MIEAIVPKKRTRRYGTPITDRTPNDVARSGTLLPDGGDETKNNNGDGETENNNGDGETEDNDGDGDAEGENAIRVLHLDVEGLFLDVLGLEIDLNEVVLDVTAVPGPRKLLGNLLSAVAGVLNGSLSGVIDGVFPDDALSAVVPDSVFGEVDLDDQLPSLSDAVFGFVNILLDVILDVLEEEDSTEETSSDTNQS